MSNIRALDTDKTSRREDRKRTVEVRYETLRRKTVRRDKYAGR